LNPGRSRFALLAILAMLGCSLGTGTTGVSIGGRSGMQVLFIGNSLTYANQLPLIVESLADSAHADQMGASMVAYPDFSLDDHWDQGDALKAIDAGHWKFVVLQQGPSSLPENRTQLRAVTARFDARIRAVGGRTVLFSVWPTIDRRADFDRAIESYTLAASDVNGVLFPVATAWLAAWRREPALDLYSDGLHPSPAGSYLAALVMYARLYNRTPIGLPPAVSLRGGGVVGVTPQVAALLQAAAAEAVGIP
jgi:hypothetical protein